MSNLSRIIGSQRREATYNNNIGVFTPTSVVNQNISNLDSNYASNNGLQIKYFTYNLSTNNYYKKLLRKLCLITHNKLRNVNQRMKVSVIYY